jgi:hypothetical protein
MRHTRNPECGHAAPAAPDPDGFVDSVLHGETDPDSDGPGPKVNHSSSVSFSDVFSNSHVMLSPSRRRGLLGISQSRSQVRTRHILPRHINRVIGHEASQRHRRLHGRVRARFSR